jgi:hypothetical protein
MYRNLNSNCNIFIFRTLNSWFICVYLWILASLRTIRRDLVWHLYICDGGVPISTSSIQWTLRVQVWVRSSFQLYVDATFSIKARASSILRAKNEPPTANLQKMLEMSIGILRSFATEWDLLHHIDKFWFKLKVTISNIHLRPSLDALAGISSHWYWFNKRGWNLKLLNDLSDEGSGRPWWG